MTVGLVATSTQERHEKQGGRIVIAVGTHAVLPDKGRSWLGSVAFRRAMTGLADRPDAFEWTWNIRVARSVALCANGYVSLSFALLANFAS